MNSSIVDARPTPSGSPYAHALGANAPAGPAGSHFAVLGLAVPLVRALVDEGYELPTPVQRNAIPAVLDGRDLLGCAQTGTGKTAAFVLPILQGLAAGPRADRGAVRALVLTPTRELAAQIGERTAAYGRHTGLRHAVVYGGVSPYGQRAALRRGVDLLIATPGRLLDLLAQRALTLDTATVLVLDEADRMLDMGFIHDVRRVLRQMPRRRQTLLFSATMPAEIRGLADDILHDPIEIAVSPEVTAAPSVSHAVWHVPHFEKRALVERVLSQEDGRRAIVFTRTKHGADRVCERLVRTGFCAGAIHGDKSQGARERVLAAFRNGTMRILVATDIAARGIDVEDIGLVINYDLPNVPESYVHRIGRAGRAGKEGAAVSFCDASERPMLADIERLLCFRIPVAGPEGAQAAAPEAPTARPASLPRAQRRGRSSWRGGRR